jgi:hypothetical protein
MLLGMICFVMILFYLTNWNDDDIRLYSWQITSATISIFCAVLLFQGLNGVIVFIFEHRLKWDQIPMCLLHFAHCFVYLLIIHYGTAIESGVLCDKEGEEAKLPDEVWVYADALQCTNDEPVEDELLKNIRTQTARKSVLQVEIGRMTEIPVQKKRALFSRRRRRTKALAMLCAHMAGFAAIFSGTSLQQVFYSIQQHQAWHLPKWIWVGMVWVPLLINQIVLRIAFKLSECIREGDIKKLRDRAKMHSDQKAIQGIDMIEELMIEEAIEAENDVSSLSMSNLTVNVVRFMITGVLPNEEGEEPEHWIPETWHVVTLFLCGVGAVGMACLQAYLMKRFQITEKRVGPFVYRNCGTIMNATGMCFAWCFLWASKWMLVESQRFEHEILARVVMAFMLNGFTCFCVFMIDKVDDALDEKMSARGAASDDAGGQDLAKEVIRIIITSLGILVGFSWEHSFDGSVGAVSSNAIKLGHWVPVVFKLVLGIAVCMLVLPAWRRYILAKVMLIEKIMGRDHGAGEAHGARGAQEEDAHAPLLDKVE